ncbi:MAG: gliding motility-associated C-terminal domain-containing protein [Bacteroidales bacterium]
MMKIRKLLLLFILLVIVIISKSQSVILLDSDAVVFCAPGSVVWTNGSVRIYGDSLYNNGYMGIVGDIQNDGKISGNGIYEIGAHWINNGTFKCGISEVILNNTISPIPPVPDQHITGIQSTSFYDLTLIGVGIKYLDLDDTVTHYLDLTDRELAVDNHIMYVTNTDPLAIQRTSGFVSNLTNGWLSRTTKVVSPYLFPMGSSIGVTRYRPVEISTLVNDSSAYVVGFFNYNATNDGFDTHSKDTTICLVDSLFYHKINRTYGYDTVNMTVYFDPLTDGPWNGLANWNLLGSSQWNNMNPVSITYSPMCGIIKSNWSTWTNLPYALIANIPDSFAVNGPQYVCLGSGPITYEAWSDPNDEYIWSVYGGQFVGDSTHNTVQILWTQAGTGVITMQEINNFGNCVSLMSTFVVTVYPNTIANFQVVLGDTSHIFVYDLIHFVDASINANQWNWDFGDGTSSAQQSPYHVYEAPGIYNVCIGIVSPDTCIDDTCMLVKVEEGLIVPNVFTPNGDGYNDEFNIRASGITQYYLQIYNRWGVLLFESNSPTIKWDGKTSSGEQVSNGTYYYILDAKSTSDDYSQHGTVTLMR